MNAIIATTTCNCVDLITTFLMHYRRLGFRHLLVMDFDSVDGTREVLTSHEWQTFVTVAPFPGLANLDSSNVLLTIATQAFAPDYWCLFCDPDELLVTPSMSVVDTGFLGSIGESDALTVPRFNVTAERSIARFDQERLTPVDALTLRIDRRQERSIEPHLLASTLVPPWIFTAIPGKTFVAIETAINIGDGDHTARTLKQAVSCPFGHYLLHYPFRSFKSFAAKIELAARDFAANPALPLSYGWQLRRWVELAKRGQLLQEYLDQFVPDENVARLLEDGTLARERCIADWH
jgi:glycosyl transferase family 2